MTVTEELAIARRRNKTLTDKLKTSVSLHANASKKAKYLEKGADKLIDKVRELEETLLRERQENMSREADLLRATDMIDQLQENFNTMAGMKMQELLDGVMIDRV